jgi:hypothetical protein
VDFISKLIERFVDFTGPYVALALVAVVIMALIYRLL